ncbi:MAG: hypothetical protein JNL90_20215 [Planctomycetes bacterium]|nr:hypothetical protein [Planctomycetota bacterium]
MEKVADSAGGAGASQGAFPRGVLARLAPWCAPWLALPYGFALFLLLGRQADLPGLLHDDAVYVAMARGIEQGLGPVDTHLGDDARTARFPPLYPALLAATRAPLGIDRGGVAGSYRWVALNGVLLGIAWFAFVHWLIRWRKVAPLVALSIAAASFTLPHLLGLAQHLMSECLFLALLCIALPLHERAAERPTGARLLLAGFVAGLLPATRTLGAAAVAAFVMAQWRAQRRAQRRSPTAAWRAPALFAVGAALPWLAATLWSATAANGAASPLYGPDYGELLAPLRELPFVAWVNAVRFADWLAYAFAPRWPLADGTSVTSALLRLLPAALLVAAALVDTARTLRRREPLPTHRLLLAALLAVQLAWPFHDLRFVLPLAPFVALAAATLLERAVGRGRNALVVAPLLALAAWNAPLGWQFLHAADGSERAAFFGLSLPVEPFDATATELRRRADLARTGSGTTPAAAPSTPTRPPAAACTLDSGLALWSGVRSVSAWRNDRPLEEGYLGREGDFARLYYRALPPPEAAERMAADAEPILAEYARLGVRWLVLPRLAGAGMPSHHAQLDRLLRDERSRPQPRLRPIWRTPGGEFELWEFTP